MKLNLLYESSDKLNSVAVVVRYDGRYLLGKCNSGRREGCWCFPGGHIESGETPIEAAKREVKEETGLNVSITHRPLGRINYRCAVFLADSKTSGPLSSNNEFNGLKWFGRNEFDSIRMLESNRKFLDKAYKEF